MRPSDKALASYVEALATLAGRVQQALEKPPKDGGPVRMFIAGGAAMHCYTGARISQDVDAVFSHRVALPANLRIAWRDADGTARALYFDTQYNDMLGPMHEDAHDDSVRLKLRGIDPARLDVRLLTPTDLAVSKLGRFADVDRGDIETLAREGLIKVAPFRARALAALEGFVGNTDRLRTTIEIACRVVEAHQPKRR